jgi:hypothetical protein
MYSFLTSCSAGYIDNTPVVGARRKGSLAAGDNG